MKKKFVGSCKLWDKKKIIIIINNKINHYHVYRLSYCFSVEEKTTWTTRKKNTKKRYSKTWYF
jgi:uncharacterized protein (UPF0303 family)